ncbi:MAG: hypothetical protein V7703_22455 [Hyphomicrobiales bacterium]
MAKKPRDPIQIELSRNVAIPIIIILVGLATWLVVTLFALPIINEAGVRLPVSGILTRFTLGGLLAVAMTAPAYTMIRALLEKRPLMTFDETGVRALNWPLMRRSIIWQDVDQLMGKGIWVILLDKNKRRHKMVESLAGAKGLWLPTALAKGGTAAVADAMKTFQPELFEMGKIS